MGLTPHAWSLWVLSCALMLTLTKVAEPRCQPIALLKALHFEINRARLQLLWSPRCEPRTAQTETCGRNAIRTIDTNSGPLSVFPFFRYCDECIERPCVTARTSFSFSALGGMFSIGVPSLLGFVHSRSSSVTSCGQPNAKCGTPRHEAHIPLAGV